LTFLRLCLTFFPCPSNVSSIFRLRGSADRDTRSRRSPREPSSFCFLSVGTHMSYLKIPDVSQRGRSFPSRSRRPLALPPALRSFSSFLSLYFFHLCSCPFGDVMSQFVALPFPSSSGILGFVVLSSLGIFFSHGRFLLFRG